MRLVYGAAAGLLVLAIGVAAADAQVRARRMPPGPSLPSRIEERPAERPPAPPQPSPGDTGSGGCVSTIARTVRLDSANRVSLDYIRVHDPEVIAAMAQSVRQGRLPASALADLGSPDLVRRVISADWSQVLPAAQASRATAYATGMRLPQQVPPACVEPAPGSVFNGGSRLAESLGAPPPGAREARLPSDGFAASILSHLMQLDITPRRIDMGSVMVGQHRWAGFRVMSPIDGTLSVRAAPGSLVHVLSVSPHAGELEPGPAGAAARPVRLAEQAVLRGMELHAGQSADVLVEFTPRLQDGFDGSPKPYDTSLSISVTPGSGTDDVATTNPLRPGNSRLRASGMPEQMVDLHATIDGRLYGIGVAMTPRVYADARTTFPVYFDWYNNGVAGDATLTVDQASLPAGVTVSGPASASLRLDPGEEKQWAYLTFNGPQVDPPGPPTNSWDLPPPDQEPKITFILSQSSAQGAQTTRYTVPVHIGGVSTWYNFYDWSRFPGRASVYHHYYVRLSTDGSYMSYIKVGASDYDNDHSCFRYHDSTTVNIDANDIYSDAGVFYDTIETGYYDAGMSGALRINYDAAVKLFHASSRVGCEHH